MTYENLTAFLNSGDFSGAFAGGILGVLIAIGIMFLIIFIIVIYVYTSYAWMIIARKLKYKREWLAWIPIANWAMVLQLGGYHWAWVFLALIPVLGWIALFIMLIVANWRIFERRNYPGWFSLSMIIPKVGGILYLVAIGFVAFKDKGRALVARKIVKKSARKLVKRKVRRKKR